MDLAHAPIPTNDSERLLFRQMFETFVRVDCKGAVHPGLAAAWVSDESGKVWTFTLRQGARLPSGMPVTSSQVVQGWLARRENVKALGIDSTVALDDRQFSTTLRSAHQSVPQLFADPGLIILDGLASVGPVDRVYSSPQGKPVVDLQLKPNSDPRDALDSGADLIVTRDPALVDYVAGQPEFAALPLPWSRTYVFLQPAAAQPLEMVRGDPDRRSLARDAVSADARPSEPPFWWNEMPACPTRSPSGPTPASSRVAYIQGDEVARGLAERIVALAGSATGLRAVAMEPAEFARLLRTGSEQAYVVALPRHTLAPCRESDAWPEKARIQPLIDTRAYAIARKGAPPLTVDWDGTVRVVPR